jgi:hypothetical protein
MTIGNQFVARRSRQAKRKQHSTSAGFRADFGPEEVHPNPSLTLTGKAVLLREDE